METLFSKPPEILYFNSANLSICPNSVLSAMDTYRRNFELNPTQSLKDSWGKLWKVQTQLAQFLGAKPTDMILRTNVTEILNTFILGTPAVPGDEILIGELEYGSVANICRLRAERDHLNLRVLKIPQSQTAVANLTSNKFVDLLISQFSPKTRILVLSHVIAGLGLRIPIEQISEVTRQRGIYFIVDGAYAPGAISIDFADLQNIDFYGCSLYKWLLGPKGTAFGWVHPKIQESLVPQQAGWTTFESQGDFAQFGAESRFQQKFQLAGCRDFSPFFAIPDVIKFWKTLRPEHIQKHILKLNRLFQTNLSAKLSWGILLPGDPNLIGPMTVFRLPEKLQAYGEGLANKVLAELKLQLHFTYLNSGWHGVFSPHIYNTEEEVELLISKLKKLN